MPLFIPNDFRDDREIVRFSDIKGLVNAIERMVSEEIDWRELAARSREWLRTHHTTERRAETTLYRVNAAFSR
jgi:spore maturation protein CgeB